METQAAPREEAPAPSTTNHINHLQPSGVLRLVLTSVAACIAETITFPIDIVKTRMQLQGELLKVTAAHQSINQGMFSLARNIVRTEGAHGLFAGVKPAMLRHVFYSGTRITVYEQLRAWATKDQQLQGKTHSAGLGTTLLIGLTAGAVGQAVAVPADLIKVRMQSDGRLVASGVLSKPRYTSILDAVKQIVRHEGGIGLWRGASPAIQRAALVNLGELATYDTAKQTLLQLNLVPEGPAAAGCASLCSGFVAALVSTPADVIKTRLMAQDNGKPLYTGTLNCLTQSVKAEGVMALVTPHRPMLPCCLPTVNVAAASMHSDAVHVCVFPKSKRYPGSQPSIAAARGVEAHLYALLSCVSAHK